MLGTRAVVTMPGVIQSDQVKSEASSDSANTSEAALNDSEEDSDGLVEFDSSATSSDASSKRKKNVLQKQSRKAKKGRVTAATAMVDLTGKLVEMQSSQMEMMERAQSQTEELLIKMAMEQRKLDENQGEGIRNSFCVWLSF